MNTMYFGKFSIDCVICTNKVLQKRIEIQRRVCKTICYSFFTTIFKLKIETIPIFYSSTVGF